MNGPRGQSVNSTWSSSSSILTNGSFRSFTAVFLFEVLEMVSVLIFDLLDPVSTLVEKKVTILEIKDRLNRLCWR
jgi:hypothetical protein